MQIVRDVRDFVKFGDFVRGEIVYGSKITDSFFCGNRCALVGKRNKYLYFVRFCLRRIFIRSIIAHGVFSDTRRLEIAVFDFGRLPRRIGSRNRYRQAFFIDLAFALRRGELVTFDIICSDFPFGNA